MYASEPLPHFVDDYLAHLQEVHPTRASLDGVHLHEDLLENLSRQAINNHVRALAGFGRRLRQIDRGHLSPTDQVEHEIVEASIEARLHDLETVRIWERNPQPYAEIIGTSLASQTMVAYAPEAERARRVVSKLRQVPRLVEAARDNVRESAGIFVKAGLKTWRGVLSFIERDLPKAFSTLDDLHILGDLADTSTEAATAVAEYIGFLKHNLAPRAKASFRLGREAFERKLRHEEGITLDADCLLAIAERELHQTQDEFRTLAGRLDGGGAMAAWKAAKSRHPEPGALADTVREQVAALGQFLERHAVVSMPETDPVVVAPSPEFYRWVPASMWTPGPFETRPSRTHYYLTDVDRSWAPERQQEHMLDFNVPALWNVSIHEVYPGHFLQFQHLRGVQSKVRKTMFLAPVSWVEGWAHYSEQMMSEAGFGREDASIRLGQLTEALVRLARFVVAVRLHCEDLSVEQGMRIFRDEAFLEEATARREAERGTFDPSYLACSAGRLMLLKLRQDFKEEQGNQYSLKRFHDAVLAQGNAPFWAHRRLLLQDPSGAVLE